MDAPLSQDPGPDASRQGPGGARLDRASIHAPPRAYADKGRRGVSAVRRSDLATAFSTAFW